MTMDASSEVPNGSGNVLLGLTQPQNGIESGNNNLVLTKGPKLLRIAFKRLLRLIWLP